MASSSTAEKSSAGAAPEVRLLLICTGSAESRPLAGDGLLASLLTLGPPGVAWSTMNERFAPEKVVRGRSLAKLLDAAAIDWIDGQPPGAPTHRVTVVARWKKRPVARLRASMFSAAPSEREYRLALRVELPASWLTVSASAWLTAVVRSEAPRWARIDGPKAADSESAPRAGWLTYLSTSLGRLPPIPPPTRVVPVDDLGWILVAQPEPVDDTNPDHRASLAHVRFALGALVLQDGPAFPPPNHEPVVAAVIAPSGPVPAPELPSYLRASPAEGTSPSGHDAVASPSAKSAGLGPSTVPFSAETSDIDVAGLLAKPVPFQPSIGAAQPAVANPRDDTPSPPAPARSGDTVDVDIGTIARRALVFGSPERAPKSPIDAPLAAKGTEASLPPVPPGKRWRRFDPQTGQPLLPPVLEDVPPSPAATPPLPARLPSPPPEPEAKKGSSMSTETLDLDPTMLAAALRKGGVPFPQ